MIVPVAHASHWLVNVMMIAPVLIAVAVGLFWARGHGEDDDPNSEQPPGDEAPDGRERPDQDSNLGPTP